MKEIYVILMIDNCTGDKVDIDEGFFLSKQKAIKRCFEKNLEYAMDNQDYLIFKDGHNENENNCEDFLIEDNRERASFLVNQGWLGPDGAFYVEKMRKN